MFHLSIKLLELARHAKRTEGLDLLRHVVDHGLDLLTLGGGDPLQAQSVRFDPHVREDAPEHPDAPGRLVVPFLVMAVAGVAAADQDAVGALGERVQDELGIEPARAHDPDDAHVGGVGHARTPARSAAV